jgi:mannose-6-phosphate isomerase-like protein (cupin superfamily)
LPFRQPVQDVGMADYTVKNLRADVEDSATKFGLSPDLETHFAGDALELEQSGVSLQRLAPGYRLQFGHRHKSQEELYVVVNGAGRLKLDDEVVDVKQWDAVRIPKSTMRSVEAGPDGLELLAFGAPATGLADADVTDGWWSE